MTTTTEAEAAEELHITISHDEFLEMVRSRYAVPEGFGFRMIIESKRSYADKFSAPETMRMIFQRQVPVSSLREKP